MGKTDAERAEAYTDAEIARLRAALEQARQFIVITCGDQAPYVKASLAVIDAALQSSP